MVRLLRIFLRASFSAFSLLLLFFFPSPAAHSQPLAPFASNQPPAPFSLDERILCQRAIEQVYARHRSPERHVPAVPEVALAAVRRKAEDAVLKSAALERFFGVTLTDERLQAELDRIAARSQAPGVLRELLDALDGDPRQAAECLARPLLADRTIRSHYAQDERLHGSLRAQAARELAQSGSALPQHGSATYTEVEWRRGHSRVAGTIDLEPGAFDARVQAVRRAVAGPRGEFELGRRSALREDDTRYYALAVLALDDERLRVATVEWRKRSFDTWWSETRARLPLRPTAASAFRFRSAVPSGARCRDDSWRPTPQLLEPRYWHTAVWTGSEMIVFGGMEAVGFVFGDGSRYDPATDTWALVSSTGAPGPREAHVAVWTGREMVVWGGRGDASGGRYDPVTDTWRPTSTLNAPAPRRNASVVWTGREMIVWGGDGGYVLNSGGRYDPARDSWTPLPPAPLTPRAYHAAVWTGSQMVVWGGYNVYMGQMYGDGARYDLGANTWSAVAGSGAPNARYFHTAVWTGSEVVVWGGINYPTYDLSGGRYNPVTNTWRPTSQVGAPSLRWMHAALWTGTQMIVAGGAAGGSSGGRYDPVADSWAPTSLVNSFGNGEGITAVWTGREAIFWGGLSDGVFHHDGRRYDPAADVWHPTGTMNVPTARGLHAGLWTGGEMIVWGGYSYGYPHTGALYDPATDSWRPTGTGGAPAGRENATAVWTGTEAIFWGGDPDGNPSDPGTGGRYSPATDTWTLTSTVDAATSRYGHTAVWTGTEMIVFGGLYGYPYSVAKRYRPATDSWSDATLTGAPGQRDHHAAVWTGTEMIVWGGFIYDGLTPTGGRYRPATDTWVPTNIADSPDTRMWPIGVWTGTEMVVWGGYDWFFTTDLGDGARYNPATDAWTVTNPAGAPSPRTAQGVWSGKELILWGDVGDSSGGRYNPLSDSWRSTTLVRAPAVLWGGRWSTVWTGQQMIVWGGMGPSQKGGLYCASGRPNSAPSANADAYATQHGVTLVVGDDSGVLANDVDVNGDPLTAALVAPPLHGVVQLNANGSFTYAPTPRFIGVDSFSYRSHDGLASSDVAEVRLTVH